MEGRGRGSVEGRLLAGFGFWRVTDGRQGKEGKKRRAELMNLRGSEGKE